MKGIVLYVAAVLLMLSCGERKECQILDAGFMNPPQASSCSMRPIPRLR